MLGLCSRAAIVGAVVTLAVVPVARAQEGRLIAVDGVLICAPYVPCDSDRPCPDPSDHCASGVCKAMEGAETPCCTPGAPCTRAGGLECVPVTDGWGHCEGEDVPPICDPASSEACFARTSWEDGDCDEDGVLNEDEDGACLCEPAGMTTVGACMRVDAGQNAQDAGGRAEDAGARSADAGARPRVDSGSGAPVPAADAWDYRGSGGCDCDASGGRGDVAWLAVALAVALGARRRRRERTGR